MPLSLAAMSAAEEATIRAFVTSPSRERMLTLLERPAKRRDLVAKLAHLADFRKDCVTDLAPGEQRATPVEVQLRRLGAPDRCSILSADSVLDGQERHLSAALADVVGWAPGSLIICLPGVLAYYEGEDPGRRFILYKQRRS